jgi:hypothetical protein
MHSRGVWIVSALLLGFSSAFAACSSDDTSSDSADGSMAGGDANGADGSTDGANASDGQPSSDGSTVTDSGSNPDAMTLPDGGKCTPRVGGSFVCGATPCTDSTTQYCIYGAVPNTCEPLPPACQCEETFTCECLLANLSCDGGASCLPHNDAGLPEAVDASVSSFFWIAAHVCSVK